MGKRGLELASSLVCVAMLVGCLRSEVTVCTTGIICPVGAVCSLDGTSCVGLEDCGNGVVDEGEDCDDGPANSNTAPNRCRLNCRNPTCGDDVHDPLGADGMVNDADAPSNDDEVCDDGNVIGGDGCSADCRSTEVCGNGIRDVVQFGGMLIPVEECDDENWIGLDGCSSSCQVAMRVWRNRATPGARSRHAVAFDAARGRVVLFGGRDGSDLGDTWEWDGAAWTNVTPALPNDSPPARSGHAMAFDAARGRVVLFGGDDGAELGDTWEWDGATWTDVTPDLPVDSPSPRRAHAMAYDAARGRVVLFGGVIGAAPLADTWEWDGATWTDETSGQPEDSPPARSNHAMAFDAARGTVVLFAGDGGAVDISDTWEWNGTTWTEMTPELPANSPPARAFHSIAFDPARGRMVLFGGLGAQVYADTWEWDGAIWTEMSPKPADSPPARLSHAMAFDPVQGNVVFFGGVNGTFFDDTWQWDGASWIDVSPALASVSPPARFDHSMTYDAARGRAVLFGGFDFDEFVIFGDTWEWDGTTWTDVTPTDPMDSPPKRLFPALAYDSQRGRVVLFGGTDDGNAPLADTWEWDGTTWSDATPATDSPPARSSHAVAYDAARGRVVLFGGTDDGNARLADTWEWDGTTWSDVTPVEPEGSPSPRSGHAMSFDAARGRVVLFGGNDGLETGDTWEWDGTVWTDLTPALARDSPPARFGHTMTFDANRDRIIVFGGADGSGPPYLGDTWEWNGVSWTDVTPALPSGFPPPRFNHAMTFDAARGRSVVFGGTNVGLVAYDDTWRLTFSAVGPRACHTGLDGDGDGLIGCDDPDCWGYCTPRCSPSSTPMWPTDCDSSLPQCGDGTCDANLESCRLCPSDCGSCTPVCGDYVCDPGETVAACPGDCP